MVTRTRARPARHPERWLRMRVALSALVLVVVTTAAALIVAGSGSGRVVPSEPTSLPPPSGVNFASELPSSLRARAFVQVEVWTGSELVTFGSEMASGELQQGGLAYKPATGEWRVIADGPFDPPLASPSGLWDGKHLVVVGVPCANPAMPGEDLSCSSDPGRLVAASYDPLQDKWEALPDPPKVEVGPEDGIAWIEPVGVVGGRAVFRAPGSYVALARDSSRWEALPDPPTDTSSVCVLGGSLRAFRPSADPGAFGFTVSTLSPKGAWEDGPSLSVPGWPRVQGLAVPSSLVCGDAYAFAYTINLEDVFVLRVASGEWKQVPEPPAELRKRPAPTRGRTDVPDVPVFNFGAWTGRELAVWEPGFHRSGPDAFDWPGVAVALDPESGTWRSATPGPLGSPQVWIDGYEIWLGRAGGEQVDQVGIVTYLP